MGLVIATVNMKGGVGKTTLTVNLATCLAKNHQKRVLVVDLDTQISATLSLMSPQDFAKARKTRRTLSHLIDKAIRPNIQSKLAIKDVIQPYVCTIKELNLLPGDIDLYDEYLVSEMLHNKAVSEEKSNFSDVWNHFEKLLIKSILEPIIDDYDFIILDCAPGYNLLTRSGIVASDFYLLPARPEPLSVVGIQLLERRIAKLKESHNSGTSFNLQLLGIVFILSGGLIGRYYNQVMKRVTEDFSPNLLFKNRIPMDVNVAKAVDSFMPVVLATPTSSGAKAFTKLTNEFLQKVEAHQNKVQNHTKKMNLANLE
ncbi:MULTISPECIES: ParA family protein [unclassified Coleofasciculus]|uniref:ParA family protein n=1 Tax=unclassified Coleofasciculus TaxID=2692782 RepID=UPI0018825476|nr:MULTISPECIES: ParA family protein [unclassified Coleofasciculus]MBE9126880.1 ParA family protein [Coleofasciculus sp. LEGE 07081]MBE9150245.1 ParA family protein [Coleofasciculus sp. LEGE 07092]